MKLSNKQIQISIIIISIIILITIGIIIGITKKEKVAEKTPEIEKTATPEATAKVATKEATPEAEPQKPNLMEIAKKYLPNGQELEHQVLQGNFGPWKNAIIFFYKEKDCFKCHFYGKILIPQNSGYKQLDLPDFHQFDNETVDNIGIASVIFTNLDRDEQNEIVILNEGYRKGPSGYPLFNTAVLNWQYYKLTSMKEWENYFNENCANAQCLKKYINAYFNFFGEYSAENDYLTANLSISSDGKGNLNALWDAAYGKAHMCKVNFNIEVIENNLIKILKNGNEKGEIHYLSNDKVQINFNTDLSELDCGSGHPDQVELQQK